MALISSLMAVSIAKSSQLGMSSTSSNTIAMQANQYAETEAEILRHTNYNDLSSKGKTTIAGTSYSKQIIVGAESVNDSTKDIKQKQCVVSIYKDNEVIPRSTLTVTRLSKDESNTSSVPQGTILPWYGKLADIPSGYALCNGSNGTPDLRDRFLVGAGKSYQLSATGGENTHVLTVAEMPSHTHNCYGDRGWDGTAIFGFSDNPGQANVYKSTTATGGNQPHENRPPYYAVYYIMKL